MTLFVDMLRRTPRVVRALTNLMDSVVVVEGEIMFVMGDVCHRMIFITDGRFSYRCDERALATTPRAPNRPRRKGRPGFDILRVGDVVSEVALWTNWENYGNLQSDYDALIVALDAKVFTKEIV